MAQRLKENKDNEYRDYIENKIPHSHASSRTGPSDTIMNNLMVVPNSDPSIRAIPSLKLIAPAYRAVRIMAMGSHTGFISVVITNPLSRNTTRELPECY